ncbi:sensor histidine kinase [Maribacter sp. 2308TA10-17]|uniref:sensor histidine kinase n=1 Tax=Maribacter sp. 2308TA10-17 TaxID=3386276 RepID=UPI0039BC7C0F
MESRISRRIHDEIANDIFGVMLNLENSKDNRSNSGSVLHSLNQVYHKARDISRNLDIPVNQGFQNSLMELIDSMTYGKKIRINPVFKRFHEDFNISETIHIVIYRVIQELLTNVIKHANAKEVFIQFFARGNRVEIYVEDDGIGFDSTENKFGGLKNVESRVGAINGKIRIDSASNKGTLITIEIPIKL